MKKLIFAGLLSVTSFDVQGMNDGNNNNQLVHNFVRSITELDRQLHQLRRNLALLSVLADLQSRGELIDSEVVVVEISVPASVASVSEGQSARPAATNLGLRRGFLNSGSKNPKNPERRG